VLFETAEADMLPDASYFLTKPLDKHGHELRCYMRDPDGYLIEVGGYTPKAIELFLRNTS